MPKIQKEKKKKGNIYWVNQRMRKKGQESLAWKSTSDLFLSYSLITLK